MIPLTRLSIMRKTCIHTKRAYGIKPMQYLIAFFPAVIFPTAKHLPAGSVDKQQLIGIHIGDIDYLVDLIKYISPLCDSLHSPYSPHAPCDKLLCCSTTDNLILFYHTGTADCYILIIYTIIRETHIKNMYWKPHILTG